MASVNRVSLLGNVGKDPEVITFDNGNKCAKFTLATTERYKDRSGELKEETEWHNVTVFGKLSEIVEKYVSKGVQVYVEGKLHTRSWSDDNGNKRYSTEITATNIQLLTRKEGKPEERESSEDLPF